MHRLIKHLWDSNKITVDERIGLEDLIDKKNQVECINCEVLTIVETDSLNFYNWECPACGVEARPLLTAIAMSIKDGGYYGNRRKEEETEPYTIPISTPTITLLGKRENFKYLVKLFKEHGYDDLTTHRNSTYHTLTTEEGEKIKYSLTGTSRAGKNPRILLKVHGTYTLQADFAKHVIMEMDSDTLYNLIRGMYNWDKAKKESEQE